MPVRRVSILSSVQARKCKYRALNVGKAIADAGLIQDIARLAAARQIVADLLAQRIDEDAHVVFRPGLLRPTPDLIE